MKAEISILLLLVTVLSSSCYYDKEELLYGTTVCDTANVKYTTQIAPVISASCLSCHGGNASAGGGIQLGDYSSFKVQAANGKLLGSVTQVPGFSPMPKGGAKLSDCNVAVIRTWIRNGMPNN
ncbi:MAG: hypothetical protein QM725_11905 [Lacibacter sp.]